MKRRTTKSLPKKQSAEIKHVVRVSTDSGMICEYCRLSLSERKFAELVNHYIDKHKLKLLHVGTETRRDDEGKPSYSTVAVLRGSNQSAPPKSGGKIIIEIEDPDSRDS